MDEKLLIPRATRVEEKSGKVLRSIEQETGMKSAEVDREVLHWFAAKVAPLRRPGQALRHFLCSLRLVTA